MSKSSIYIETSVVSYFTSRPSRDLVAAARQQLTREWWEKSLPVFAPHISTLVLEEAKAGDQKAAQARLVAVAEMPVLEINDAAKELAANLIAKGPIASRFAEDALHIGLAAAHGMDYLVTWNFRHINNAKMKLDITRIVHDHEYECPMICSPEELEGA